MPNSKTYPGFAIGAFGGCEIDDVFGIEAHLTVSNQGVKYQENLYETKE